MSPPYLLVPAIFETWGVIGGMYRQYASREDADEPIVRAWADLMASYLSLMQTMSPDSAEEYEMWYKQAMEGLT